MDEAAALQSTQLGWARRESAQLVEFRVKLTRDAFRFLTGLAAAWESREYFEYTEPVSLDETDTEKRLAYLGRSLRARAFDDLINRGLSPVLVEAPALEFSGEVGRMVLRGVAVPTTALGLRQC
jgi:hypothetical protein